MSRRLSSSCFRNSLRHHASQSSFHILVPMVSSFFQFVDPSLPLHHHHHNIAAIGFTGPSIIHSNQLQFLSIWAFELPLLPSFASISSFRKLILCSAALGQFPDYESIAITQPCVTARHLKMRNLASCASRYAYQVPMASPSLEHPVTNKWHGSRALLV